MNASGLSAVGGGRTRGLGIATHEEFARTEARSLIIHYPPNTAIRLACADLG